jgi:hypothetical protein
MSKSENAGKESGAHAFGKNNKNHDKPAHQHGPVETGKHERPFREEGAITNAKKPLVHSEQVGVTHNGRALPSETDLERLEDHHIGQRPQRTSREEEQCLRQITKPRAFAQGINRRRAK